MTHTFFSKKQKKNEEIVKDEEMKLKLSKLSAFIQTEENASKLYDENGHIDFSTLDLGSVNASNIALGAHESHFNCANKESLKILTYTLEQYTAKLHKLQTVDFKLALSLTIAAIAIPLSPLMLGFGALVSASAFIYFGMMLERRNSVQEEYKKAQNDMTAVYIWIMNDTESTISADFNPLPQKAKGESSEEFSASINEKLHAQVKEMHRVVNPMLSDKDLYAYTEEKLEAAITDAKKSKEDKSIENESTTKLQLSLNYLFYGQDQGSALQVSKGLLSLFGQTLLSVGVAIKDAAVSLSGFDKEAEKAPHTETENSRDEDRPAFSMAS